VTAHRARAEPATQQLSQASDTPRLDAEVLMAHALASSATSLLLSRQGPGAPQLIRLVERRRAGEPVAYITGKRAFWNIELEVGPGALIPRPDSETLIVAAIDISPAIPARGESSTSAPVPGPCCWRRSTSGRGDRGSASDSSKRALDYASRNARRLGPANRAQFRAATGPRASVRPLTWCSINPPYVAEDAELAPEIAEHEPPKACTPAAKAWTNTGGLRRRSAG
jgi:release factor glutamine methyltransferase